MDNPLGYAIWLARIASREPSKPAPTKPSATIKQPKPKSQTQSQIYVPPSHTKLLSDAILTVWPRVTWEQIESRYTQASILLPRQVFCYLAREHLRKGGQQVSFPEIARMVNRRDHTPAINSYEKIKKLLEIDENLRAKVAAVVEIYRASVAKREQKIAAP